MVRCMSMQLVPVGRVPAAACCCQESIRWPSAALWSAAAPCPCWQHWFLSRGRAGGRPAGGSRLQWCGLSVAAATLKACAGTELLLSTTCSAILALALEDLQSGAGLSWRAAACSAQARLRGCKLLLLVVETTYCAVQHRIISASCCCDFRLFIVATSAAHLQSQQ